MTGITRTESATVPALAQSLQPVTRLTDLDALKGVIIAYVANTGLKASYVPEDLSFGYITKSIYPSTGEPIYELKGLLRGTRQADQLLITDELYQVTDRKVLREENLTGFIERGIKTTFSTPAPSRTHTIAVHMGIASPKALDYLVERGDASKIARVTGFPLDKIIEKTVVVGAIREVALELQAKRESGEEV